MKESGLRENCTIRLNERTEEGESRPLSTLQSLSLPERPQRQMNGCESSMQASTQKAVTCAKPETVEEERCREIMYRTGAEEPRSAKTRGMNIRISRSGRVLMVKRRLLKATNR